MNNGHYRVLEKMYSIAPINQYFQPAIVVEENTSIVTIEVRPDFFHTGRAMHGCVYFKALDDSAYFAAHSIETEYFIVTTDFRIDFIRPVTSGLITAIGTIVHSGRNDILCESELRNNQGKLIGKGFGRFARSTVLLSSISLQ